MSPAVNRPITDLFESSHPVLSVEFFPPKTEDSAVNMMRTANALHRSFRPDFISMTYGAGGGTRERTMKYGRLLKEEYEWQVMPHLTCVGSSRDELKEILDSFHETGFRNIMTLRGDPPKGQKDFKPHPDGLRYANELVEFIKGHYPEFCLGVAGYPEKHPEAPSWDIDIVNLKRKVEVGGEFITTQMFFTNTDYHRYVERCREAGIEVPIIAGIMPVTTLKPGQTDFFGAAIPPELLKRYEAAQTPAEQIMVGVDWCFDQIVDLMESGCPGVHLYIMNRSRSALALMERLRTERPEIAGERFVGMDEEEVAS